MNEIDFINAKLNRQNVPVPQFLYKYRPFDKHTFDMLDNSYVYLSSAENLDDPSECKVDFNVQDLVDIKTNHLTFKGVGMILDFVKPYTTAENFEQAKHIIFSTLTPDGIGQGPDLLDAYFDLQELMPEESAVQLVNQVKNIPERINTPEVRNSFEKLFSLARDARRDMGICSLSELKNDGEMWRNYAIGSTGYCVEYDMREYKQIESLFPVVYQENRETNIVTSILGAFIGEMIFGISNGQIDADKTQFIRLFLTKDLEWSYQKELRLIGDAGQHLPAPKINAIYLGKNMPKQSKQQMIDYCKAHNIKV